MVEKFRDCHERWVGNKCILYTYPRLKSPVGKYDIGVFYEMDANSYFYTIYRRESLTKFFYDEIERYEKIRRYTIDEDNL